MKLTPVRSLFFLSKEEKVFFVFVVNFQPSFWQIKGYLMDVKMKKKVFV